MGDADIAGEFGAVEQVAGPRRAGPDEPLEVAQAADPDQLSKVAFQIGADVGLEEIPCGDVYDAKRLLADVRAMVEEAKNAGESE